MRKHSIVGGLIWLVLGIGMCIESIKLNLGNFSNPGAGLTPFLSGVVIGSGGLILIFSATLKALREEEGKDKKIWRKENLGTILLFLLTLFSYGLLFEPLGFPISSLIFLSILFILPEPKRWRIALVFSLITIIISFLVFFVLLQCNLPGGMLRDIQNLMR
jgi:uncharacterized BrkB/YihY/UPF0761 family membrane protein